jgi:cell division protein FtsW (lipid II flippase)
MRKSTKKRLIFLPVALVALQKDLGAAAAGLTA